MNATSAFASARGYYSTRFRREWIGRDVVAGLVLASLLVPQGMAYAELAGLPAITGLYTSILCLVAYALVGPSRILVLGPDSSLGPMIAATILPLIGRRRRPAEGGRVRICAGAHGRRGDARRRACRPGLHCRPAVQADPDRLHERPRVDDLRRPAAQAVRLLERREWLDRRDDLLRARSGGRRRPCRQRWQLV